MGAWPNFNCSTLSSCMLRVTIQQRNVYVQQGLQQQSAEHAQSLSRGSVRPRLGLAGLCGSREPAKMIFPKAFQCNVLTNVVSSASICCVQVHMYTCLKSLLVDPRDATHRGKQFIRYRWFRQLELNQHLLDLKQLIKDSFISS